MSTGVIPNFKPAGLIAYLGLSGTYSGEVDHEGKARGHGVLTGLSEHAGWRLEGEWEDRRMRRGEVRMGGVLAGWRYVGEFDDIGLFHGRGELSLPRGRRFNGEWEAGCARRGVAEESDGVGYRVAFEGWRGAFWTDMERVFDDKQSFRGFVTSASWDLLPVRSPPLPTPLAARGNARLARPSAAAAATALVSCNRPTRLTAAQRLRN
jgi:hypothetical protein